MGDHSSHWKESAKEWALSAESERLTPNNWLKYCKTLRKIGDLTRAKEALVNAEMASDERTLLQEKALLLTALNKWKDAVLAWENFISRKDLRPNRDAWLHLASARFQLGDISQAAKDLENFERLCEATKKSLQLREQIGYALKAETIPAE
jgi:tetratricopeptide (TPR) repeat protein